MIQKIISIKDTVIKILRNHPETRDNDRLLIVKVWCEQNHQLRNSAYEFMSFGIDFIAGKYADTESIRRSRQKIQEQNPELRGTKYSQRQQEEVNVRKNIGRLKTQPDLFNS